MAKLVPAVHVFPRSRFRGRVTNSDVDDAVRLALVGMVHESAA